MKFLVPVGGVVDHQFGVMTHPGHRGVPAGIKGGMEWAADNQAFTGKFDPDGFAVWLNMMEPYRKTCLFIALPDVVGDANATLRLFEKWIVHPMYRSWPLAFVAQDGQEGQELPHSDAWNTLFVGGSTEWKVSDKALSVIKQAQALGKRIHIGRVNYWKRYNRFAQIIGSKEFTCDGTRTRFGRDKALEAWSKYQNTPVMELWKADRDVHRRRSTDKPAHREVWTVGERDQRLRFHRPGSYLTRWAA